MEATEEEKSSEENAATIQVGDWLECNAGTRGGNEYKK